MLAATAASIEGFVGAGSDNMVYVVVMFAAIIVVSIVTLIGMILLVAWRYIPPGTKGELLTRNRLHRGLGRAEYRIFHDLFIPRPQDPQLTTQIDHLVVSRYGVFVVETKNIAGQIHGGPKDKHWTLVYGRKRHSLFSPIRQNRGHANAVASFLDIERRCVHPLVALVGSGQAQTDLGPEVTTGETLLPSILARDTPLLAAEEVTRCLRLLHSHRQATSKRRVRREHKLKLSQERALRDRRVENRREYGDREDRPPRPR